MRRQIVAGLAVDHDDVPDCAQLARRGVKAYRFPIRWDRVVQSTTFYHDESAVDGSLAQADSQNTQDDAGILLPGFFDRRQETDTDGDTMTDDATLWAHEDPRWHRIDAAAWEGLPMTRLIVDPAAIRHYATLMIQLRTHGIEPVPILDVRHMPQALDHVINGWCSPLAVEAYAQFAHAVFVHLSHMADLWVSAVPPYNGDEALRRAFRHMLLAQARVAAIYHRGTSNPHRPLCGRFAVAFACGRQATMPMRITPKTNAIDDNGDDDDCQHRWFDRTVQAFALAVSDRDDGFGWGFTTAQRALLSRTVDAVLLECALCDPIVAHETDPLSSEIYHDVAAAHYNTARTGGEAVQNDVMAAGDINDPHGILLLGNARAPTMLDRCGHALARWIDHAAETLPGVPILVCDGAPSCIVDGHCRRQEAHVGANDPVVCNSAEHNAEYHGNSAAACLQDTTHNNNDNDDGDFEDAKGTNSHQDNDDRGDSNRNDDSDDDAIVAALALRYKGACEALGNGRPIEMYLVRPG